MKLSEFFCQPPFARLLRVEAASSYLAGEQNLRAAEQAGWFKAIIRHKGCTAFDRADLDLAIDRAKLEGGWPICKPKLGK